MGARKPDPKLIKLLVKAHTLKKLLAGGGTHLEEFAVQAKLNASYFTRVLRLSYLAPDITRAILARRG